MRRYALLRLGSWTPIFPQICTLEDCNTIAIFDTMLNSSDAKKRQNAEKALEIMLLEVSREAAGSNARFSAISRTKRLVESDSRR